MAKFIGKWYGTGYDRNNVVHERRKNNGKNN